MDDKLAKLKYQAMLPVTKDHWVPSIDKIPELAVITIDILHGYRERALCPAWADRRSEANAMIKVQNGNIKKMRDEIISQGGEKHHNMINNIIELMLVDKTIDLRQRVVNWTRTTEVPTAEQNITTTNLEE